MSQPPPYAPTTQFFSYQTQQAWFPGQNLDVEFNNLKTSITGIEKNLALIQRDDGALANGSVDFPQLSAAVVASIGPVLPLNVTAFNNFIAVPHSWSGGSQKFGSGVNITGGSGGTSGAITASTATLAGGILFGSGVTNFQFAGANAVWMTVGTVDGQIGFAGTGVGTTTLKTANAGGSSFVLTLPAVTDTIAGLTAAQTFTNKIFSGNTTFPDGSVWGAGGLTMGTFSVGTPLINFLSSGNVVQYDTRFVAVGGNATAGGGTLFFNGAFQVNPQANSLMTAFSTLQSKHGSTGGLQNYGNVFNVSADDADCGSSLLTSYSVGMLNQHNFGGSNTTGGRLGLFGSLLLTAPTNSANAVRFYAAVCGQGQANSSDGGTIGGGLEKGKIYGSNFIGAALNGSTGFEHIMAGYHQIQMLAGSSAKTKAINALVYGGSPFPDAVQGSTYDAALMIGAETGAVAGGKNAILIGNMFGAQPLASTGTVLAFTGSPTVDKGIDLSGATISTAAFKSTGFTVDGSGIVSAAFFRASGNIATLTGTAPPAGGSGTMAHFLSSANVGVYTGTGNPTVSAAKGSLYLENGSGQLWINASGSTTWTQITVP